MLEIGKMRGVAGMRSLQLKEDTSAALAAWQALPAEDESKAHYFVRYVSVDVATSGLRPGEDALLGLAAVGVQQGAIGGSDVCAYDLPRGNAAGSVADHLVAFLAYVGKAPLVTFQAAFVDAFLRRAFAEHLGIDFSPPWIDLAWVLPEFFGHGAGNGTLDDWLQRFRIELPGRREALSDAVAVARLLLAAQAEATRNGIETPKKLREIERNRRWLRGG